MNSRLTLKSSILVLVAIGAATIGGYFWIQTLVFQNAISMATSWTRLNDLPPSATDVAYQSSADVWTNRLVVTFQADLAEIKEWLANSPGTKNVEPIQSGGRHKYVVERQYGQEGEVVVEDFTDGSRGRVRIVAIERN